LASDKLGKTAPFRAVKERIGFQFCSQYQIQSKFQWVVATPPDIKTIIEAHANTYRVAKTY
jgi:hypothetical protein